jgi:hypothetical protein
VRGRAVVREHGLKEGTKHTHLGGLHVEGQCGEGVVAYPHHQGPARQSRIQFQRGVFSRRVPSLERTLSLNTEL